MRNAEDLAQFDRVLFDAARKLIEAKGRNEFAILELVRQLKLDYPEFSENAIRKHVVSKCGQTDARSFGLSVCSCQASGTSRPSYRKPVFRDVGMKCAKAPVRIADFAVKRRARAPN
jgi:hypothetical protein